MNACWKHFFIAMMNKKPIFIVTNGDKAMHNMIK